MISVTQRKRILLYVSVFVAIFVYNIVNTFIPGNTYDVISFAYMGFALVWYLSIRERVVNRSIRNFFLIGTSAIILLFILRVCKWNYFGMFTRPNEYLWYLFYFTILALPLVSLLIALRIGVYKRRKARIVSAVFGSIGALLFLIVITNSLHNFVFKIKDLDPDHMKYSFGYGYYMVVLFSLTCIITAFVILLRRCSLSASRRLAFIPVIVLILGITMIAVYYVKGGAPKLFGAKLYNIQEAFEFLFIAFWESCIQIGLIPTNSDYDTIFQASGLDAYIADESGHIVYRTADFSPREKDPDIRVTEQQIRGGKVVWQDDLSKINETKATLTEVTKELADENELLEMEHETNSKKEEMDALMNLYDELYDSVRPEISSLRRILSSIRRGSPEEALLIRKATVLGAFIKRRANFSILAHNSPEININELEYALRESMYYVDLTKTKCSLIMNGKGTVSSEFLIRMYEVFHAVSTELLDEKCSIMVNVGKTVGFSMRIMTDKLLDPSFAEKLKERFKEGTEVSFDEDEEVTYIVCA